MGGQNLYTIIAKYFYDENSNSVIVFVVLFNIYWDILCTYVLYIYFGGRRKENNIRFYINSYENQVKNIIKM